MSIFTFLAEILGTKELPGSFDLLTQLLDTLGKIIHYDSPIPSDTSYPCQMLMAAVEQAASKITVFDSIAHTMAAHLSRGEGAPC
jgi:U3 small nucleolar RNA-associated protein 10